METLPLDLLELIVNNLGWRSIKGFIICSKQLNIRIAFLVGHYYEKPLNEYFLWDTNCYKPTQNISTLTGETKKIKSLNTIKHAQYPYMEILVDRCENSILVGIENSTENIECLRIERMKGVYGYNNFKINHYFDGGFFRGMITYSQEMPKLIIIKIDNNEMFSYTDTDGPHTLTFESGRKHKIKNSRLFIELDGAQVTLSSVKYQSHTTISRWTSYCVTS